MQVTPHSPTPLTECGGFRIGAGSVMYALLNVSGNDITVTTVITRTTATVKYKVNILKNNAKFAVVNSVNLKKIHNVAAKDNNYLS